VPLNSRAEPFGPSVLGFTWGNTPWEEAYQWPGSAQVALGKRILERFPWWQFEPHQEWVAPTEDEKVAGLLAAAAGIPGKLRVSYLAAGRGRKLLALESGSSYKATYVSPIDGKQYPADEPVIPDADGSCDLPKPPIRQDWVLVLKREK
jgi:hypothetical protein